jgi:hypothetical protein
MLPVSTDTSHVVRGEVMDELIEALVLAAGPAARAGVIAHLVQELCVTVECWSGNDAAPAEGRTDELTSLLRVREAAQDHQRRMSTDHLGESASLIETLAHS